MLVIEQKHIDLLLGEFASIKKAMEASYWNELLDRDGVAKDWGVNKRSLEKYCSRPVNPLPLKGKGSRITRQAAREWRDKHLNNYEEAHQ